MATQRFNYNDKFNLKDQKVGISSTTPEESLDVSSGTLKGVDLQSNSGITTFSTYEGFLNSKTSYTKNVQIETGESGSLSEVVIGAGLTMSVGTGVTTGQGSIKSLKVSNTFTPPIGGTVDRPSAPQPGALYYNKDFRTIEYWDGSFWRQVDNTTRTDRGIWAGGYHPMSFSISYVNVSTEGNAVDFGGILSASMSFGSGCSDGTRGIFGGGRTSPANSKLNNIQYLTIPSAGNAIDFGDLTNQRRRLDACSSSTRGLFGPGDGTPTNVNIIDYIEIQTLGNAVDFGDSSDIAGSYSRGALSSPVRGIFFGGADDYPAIVDIEYVTIASKGNGVKFGEMTEGRTNTTGGGFSNGVRGVIAGGYGKSPAYVLSAVIDQIIIASEGNAVDFGTLMSTTRDFGGCQNMVRGLIGGGSNPSTYQNVISKISLTTSGNSADFGDLVAISKSLAGCSGSHGGLGGF